MKLALISDIHANIEALDATLRAIAAEAADRIVCLGDIVGYNASPAECIARLREVGALCVAGNHDRAVSDPHASERLPEGAARAIAWTRTRLDTCALDFLAGLPSELTIEGQIVAVHGALHAVERRESVYLDTRALRQRSFDALASHASRVRVCGFGHTHMPGVYEERGGVERVAAGDNVILRDDALYLVNPGTVGQPRPADKPASFMLLDTTRRVLATHRVPYDLRAVAARNRAAGLLSPFSSLPQPVRSALRWGVRSVGLRGRRR